MTKPELLPCPCCSSTNSIFTEADDLVYCRDCWLRAIDLDSWNTRPAPAPDVGLVEYIGSPELGTPDPTALSASGTGWIVGDADGTRWRTWCDLGPMWTTNRDAATRYARRCDAELVHAADDDAWMITPYLSTPPQEAGK